MMPKKLMDDKQLNFNQPFLSVRRGSSTAIPEVDRRKATKPPPTVPRLPYYKSELKSGPVRNPGVIPFKWEQIPGRPKDENPLNEPSQECVSDSSSLYKSAREENGSSVSEGENSTYVDAPDSLSRTESFFLNCSVTGVSGLDGPSAKPDGAFSDPLARDLMMDRFLPAAKAVASETPHFGSKKQPVVKEQPREAMKKNPRYYYTPITLPQHFQAEEEEEDTEEEDEEEEEEEDVKLCGLLPRFCLLNAVPGMRDQVPRPMSSFRKMQKRAAKAGAFNKTDKAIRDAVYERRRLAVYKRSDMRIEADRLKHELNNLYPHNNSVKSEEAFKCPSSARANSLLPKERQFLGIPEAAKDSKPTSRRKAHTTVEKTLYIDSAQISEYRDSNSSSSESRSLTDSRGRNPSIDYSLHDIKDICCADNIPSQSQNVDSGDSNMLFSQEMLNQEEPVMPLPLPKSPSESWLSRALPSVSSRNSRFYVSTGNLGFRSPPAKLHYQDFGLPTLTPISEN